MPKVMKPPTDWDEDDIDTGYETYDGPVPPPGLYKGVVKKILQTEAVNKDTKQKEKRWLVICDISQGKYKGAGGSKWLQLNTQGRSWFHQFLHAFTDGSEEQKKGIRAAFKKHGYAIDDPDQKNREPVVRIGKSFNPIGKEISFFTKINDRADDGVKRCEIVRFVTPFNDDDDDESPEDVLDNDSDDGLPTDDDSGDDPNFGDPDSSDAFATDDDSAVQDLDSEGADPEEEPAGVPSVDAADDPWSV